jgi:hypothetical protein
MRKSAAFAAIILTQGLISCGLIISQTNNSRLMNVQVGMSRDELISIMGLPKKREAYGRTEFLIYQTGLGATEAERDTPIAVVDGRVAGWGRNYYDSAIKSRIEADVNVRQR